MTAQTLLDTLTQRGVRLIPDGTAIVVNPASRLTDADRQAIRAHKAELLRVLTGENHTVTAVPAPARDAARNLADRIGSIWEPGDWLAYRDGRDLLSAKYAGTGSDGRVNVWLADGAVRAVPADAVALDWRPDAAEIFEARLSIMLATGVPEDVARPRAERCTREYLDRLQGGTA